MDMNDHSFRKENSHKIAHIIQKGLIDDREFRFNHVTFLDWSNDCNLFFPTIHGYHWNDPRRGTHPDKDKSFFFWRDYDEWSSYPGNLPEEDNNPEWLISHHKLYVFDGSTHFWESGIPRYSEILSDWDQSSWKGDREVPIGCIDPDDETPTDRDRRYTYYRKNTCIWGLLDCPCNSTGSLCHKLETELYLSGFGSEIYSHQSDDEVDSGNDESEGELDIGNDESDGGYHPSPRVWSLSTNIDNTLGARMDRLGPE